MLGGREVGVGFKVMNICTPVADSCQCIAKPIRYCKVKKKKKRQREKHSRRLWVHLGISSKGQKKNHLSHLTTFIQEFEHLPTIHKAACHG